MNYRDKSERLFAVMCGEDAPRADSGDEEELRDTYRILKDMAENRKIALQESLLQDPERSCIVIHCVFSSSVPDVYFRSQLWPSDNAELGMSTMLDLIDDVIASLERATEGTYDETA